MKKYLKKLGILTLIAAMLAPYVSIPSVEVKAETTNCEMRLNTHVFLDRSTLYAEKGKHNWIVDQANSTTSAEGYLTFTNVLYDFPADKDIEILYATTNTFIDDNGNVDKDGLEDFWNLIYVKTKSLSNTKILEKWGDTYNTDYPFIANGYDEEDFDVVTAVFHGPWSNDDLNGEATSNEYSDFDNMNQDDVQEFINKSIQKKFSDLNEKMDIEFTNALVKKNRDGNEYNYTFEKPSSTYLKPLDDNYFKKLIAGEYEDYTFVDTYNDDMKYFTVAVTREINEKKDNLIARFNQEIFGGKITTTDVANIKGKYAVYGAGGNYGADGTDIKTSSNAVKPNESMESYTNMTNGVYYVYDAKPDFVTVDVNEHYYWPAVVNVAYKACETSTTPETPDEPTTPGTPQNPNEEVKYWNIEYTAKTEDAGKVTNLPSKHREKLGTNSKVASGVPEKEGYAFKGWCVGTETCTKFVKSGDSISALDKEGTKILYAQWAEEGPTDQSGTGVMSYVLGLSAVALVAGGIYYVSKKKNLFKQI